jgi:hypothetical protein
MRRPILLLLASLVLASASGCAEDEDLNATPGGADTGGGVSLDADAPDSSVTPPVDSGIEDTTVAMDTTQPDTAKPDTLTTFDTAGIDIATIDTAILDGFVGPACKLATDCPGADVECAKRACRDGRCVIDFTAPDTPIASEKKGDCRIGQCDGAGLVRYLDDLTDTPAATGECTQGVCTMMGGGVANKGAGTPCSTGFCDGAGKCVECVAATTCPGTDTECRVRACVANKCTMTNLADGTVAATQVAGDCKIVLCDGAGKTRLANADTDAPDDKEVCTADSCTDGAPTHTPIYSKVPCAGETTLCSNFREGKCGECDLDSECPRPGLVREGPTYTDSCELNVCVNHMCERRYATVGTTCTFTSTYEGTYTCTGTCQAEGETYRYCSCGGS